MSDTFKVGNVTRDPELRFGANGGAVASFGIAENYKRGDEEQTSFFNVVAFGSLAENVASTLSKGQRVVIVGRLSQREYETKDGDKRSVNEIVADALGPDLRWATAEVTKTESNSGGGSKSSGGRRSGSKPAPRQPALDDEEPF